MPTTLTYAIVAAAGLDAGNRSMALAGRKAWNKHDWQAACDVTAPLFRILESQCKEDWNVTCAR